MTDSSAGTSPEPASPEPAPDATCPWCAAPAAPDASRCTACGAALAQRESIGDLLIPGLTSVDPALVDFDKRPLHLHGPSPSQGVAPALIVGALAGGPIGLVAIGGVAAVAGAEFLGTRTGGPGGMALEDIGKPSEVALQALRAIEDAKGERTTGEQSSDGADMKPEVDELPAADGGMSIWRDLPGS
ncbi:MAG: hypothetical protein ABI620_00030 [Chloroflexota bacterium]